MLIEISDLSTYQQTGERDDPIPKETETHTKRRKDKTEKNKGGREDKTLLLGHRLESLGPSCQT
jgi:hypothetical protein